MSIVSSLKLTNFEIFHSCLGLVPLLAHSRNEMCQKCVSKLSEYLEWDEYRKKPNFIVVDQGEVSLMKMSEKDSSDKIFICPSISNCACLIAHDLDHNEYIVLHVEPSGMTQRINRLADNYTKLVADTGLNSCELLIMNENDNVSAATRLLRSSGFIINDTKKHDIFSEKKDRSVSESERRHIMFAPSINTVFIFDENRQLVGQLNNIFKVPPTKQTIPPKPSSTY